MATKKAKPKAPAKKAGKTSHKASARVAKKRSSRH